MTLEIAVNAACLAAIVAGATFFVLRSDAARRAAEARLRDREDEIRKTVDGARAAETARHDGERRLRALYESGIVGIFVGSNDGLVTEANDAFLRMIGYSRVDLESGLVRWMDMTPAEWRAYSEDAMGQVQARGFAEPWEKEYVRKDGSRVPALVGIAAIDDERNICFVADLTERKRAEEASRRHRAEATKQAADCRRAEDALRRTEEQLRQAQKMEAVGRLAGGVAHDFNNVLSVILSYAEMLLTEGGEPAREDIEEIRKAAARAAGLTRQLLMFSRQQIMEPRIVDLNDELSGMEKMLRRLVGEDVQLVLSLSDGIGHVRVDPSAIEQVVMNLVVNARDAMPTGGKLTIESSQVILDQGYADAHVGTHPGPHVLVAVSDTGMGMDRATQARIFEPFFTTKEMGKGTGLGLSTVFGIVRQSGGSIWVYSEVGKGSTFKIYLPVADGVPDVARPRATPLTHQGTETVLLVEDEQQVRAVTASILRKRGYRVIEAQNAGEALLLCESFKGDLHLLLSDVVMPQMSGPELARRLGSTRPRMKVLCMSGYADDAVVRHGVLETGTAFLQKPITPDGLARKVREVLDAGRA